MSPQATFGKGCGEQSGHNWLPDLKLAAATMMSPPGVRGTTHAAADVGTRRSHRPPRGRGLRLSTAHCQATTAVVTVLGGEIPNARTPKAALVDGPRGARHQRSVGF
ncbi:hypothetical protein NN561_014808 [Cricetulus griseus]